MWTWLPTISSWFVSDTSLLFTDLTAVQHYIRDHLLTLLGIRDWKYIADAKDRCTITEQENEAFIQELPGSIKITANDFRLDLGRNRSSMFNRTAMEVFAADFHRKVTKEDWYNSPPIPPWYLLINVIGDAFYEHLKYVKSRYKALVIDMDHNSEAAQTKEGKRLQKVSRGVRKGRVSKRVIEHIQILRSALGSSINGVSMLLPEIQS